VLVTDGVETMPFHDGIPDPWQTSTTFLDPLSLAEIAIINGYDPGEDIDGDGHLDSADNCVFRANDLLNNGDFLSNVADLDDDGDACECADANGSGAVFGNATPDPTPADPADLQVIREYLVGLNTDPNVAQVCSVFESPDCNTQDAVVLQRAIEGAGPGIEVRCDAALPD